MLPVDERERPERLEQFGKDINRLASYLQDHWKEEIHDNAGSAVDIAIGILKRVKPNG